MGTKLENAVRPVAGRSQKTSIAFLQAQRQPKRKDSTSETTSNFQKLQSTMNRIVYELHSFESIRAAMLEQDSTFKQQVKELHRLYGVQKMLMNELKHKETTNAAENDSTLIKPGCFGLDYQPNNKAEAEQQQEETGLAGTSSSYNCNGYDEEEAEIELTLGIGNPKNSNKKRVSRTHLQQSINAKFEVKQQNSDQQRNKPNWLFQSLSSHKT